MSLLLLVDVAEGLIATCVSAEEKILEKYFAVLGDLRCWFTLGLGLPKC